MFPSGPWVVRRPNNPNFHPVPFPNDHLVDDHPRTRLSKGLHAVEVLNISFDCSEVSGCNLHSVVEMFQV